MNKDDLILSQAKAITSIDEFEARFNRMKDNLRKWNHDYYILDSPVVDDAYYDKVFDIVKRIEIAYPHLLTKDSPTQTVGHKIDKVEE